MMNRLERDAKNVVKFFAAVRTQVAVQCTWLKGTEIDDVALKLATADISKHGAHCPEEDSLAASRSSREWKREGSSLA